MKIHSIAFLGYYFILLYAYRRFSGVSLKVSVSNTTVPLGSTPLTWDVPVSNISMQWHGELHFVILNSTYREVHISTWASGGDADLYVKKGSEASRRIYDKRSIRSSSNPGGGGTWIFRGVHTFVIKIKKYP